MGLVWSSKRKINAFFKTCSTVNNSTDRQLKFGDDQASNDDAGTAVSKYSLPTMGWQPVHDNYLPFREEREVPTLIRQYLPCCEFGITLVFSV